MPSEWWRRLCGNGIACELLCGPHVRRRPFFFYKKNFLEVQASRELPCAVPDTSTQGGINLPNLLGVRHTADFLFIDEPIRTPRCCRSPYSCALCACVFVIACVPNGSTNTWPTKIPDHTSTAHLSESFGHPLALSATHRTSGLHGSITSRSSRRRLSRARGLRTDAAYVAVIPHSPREGVAHGDARVRSPEVVANEGGIGTRGRAAHADEVLVPEEARVRDVGARPRPVVGLPHAVRTGSAVFELQRVACDDGVEAVVRVAARVGEFLHEVRIRGRVDVAAVVLLVGRDGGGGIEAGDDVREPARPLPRAAADKDAPHVKSSRSRVRVSRLYRGGGS